MKIIIAGIALMIFANTLKVYGQADFCYTFTNYPMYDWAHVNFNYGTSDYGPALPTSHISYQYTSAAPAQGQYAIVHTTAGMRPGAWWEINTLNHSVDDEYYMMVVNGASVKSEYFYQTAIGYLCPKTTYKITQPVFNLLKSTSGANPNLTFTVCTSTGRVIKLYNAGDIQSDGTWKNIEIEFTTDNVSIYNPREEIFVKITNNTAGGAGNVFALERINFLPVSPTINSTIDASGQTQLSFCAGIPRSFVLTSDLKNDYQHPTHIWQVSYGTNQKFQDMPGETASTLKVDISAQTTGTIRYHYASAEGDNINCENCRAYGNLITFTINPLPIPNAFNDVSGCEGEPLAISPSTITYRDNTYQWSGPNNYYSALQSPIIPEAALSDAGTYHVIIRTPAGCIVEGDVKVTVNPKITVTAGGPINICAGSSTQLQVTANNAVSYTWQPTMGLSDPSIANPIASPNSTTTYTVTATSNSGCSAKASVTVNVSQPPTVNAGTDQTITEGEKVVLHGKIDGSDYRFYWTPTDGLSNSTILNPVANPTSDATYTLHVIDNNNCAAEATDDVFIKVYRKVTIPNVFSPNGDGVNDTWVIDGLDAYPESTMQVFSRSGALIYQNNGYTKAWNGTYNGRALPVGTYYYKIDLKNGKVMSGSVTIIK